MGAVPVLRLAGVVTACTDGAHVVGQFDTCTCECPTCWDPGPPDRFGRCLCPFCDDDEHDHMGREPLAARKARRTPTEPTPDHEETTP